MDLSDIQRALAEAGWYRGPIDGLDGPQMRAAVAAAEDAQPGLYPVGADAWPNARRAVAAAQVALTVLGHEPGAIDGYAGHNTAEAYRAMMHRKAHGRPEVIARAPHVNATAPAAARDLPRQSECTAVYGRPGPEIQSQLVTAKLPFAMRLDWALDQTVTKVTLHRLAAPTYVGALEAVRDRYDIEQMRALGIDRFAGGYVHRKMRGGTSWSMHAYGIAVDHYAGPNGLRMACPEALFCGTDYKPFLDIMEAHGWLPAIRLWGKDAMHFQRARMG